MESTCSTKSARWSQCWVYLKCDQPVIGPHIVVTLGQSFKMGAICNWQAHFGHSGSKHSECAQFLTIIHIVDPLQRTFKMYPIFNHWVHCGQVLSVPTMYSPCAHWVYGSLSPVELPLPPPNAPTTQSSRLPRHGARVGVRPSCERSW